MDIVNLTIRPRNHRSQKLWKVKVKNIGICMERRTSANHYDIIKCCLNYIEKDPVC